VGGLTLHDRDQVLIGRGQRTVPPRRRLTGVGDPHLVTTVDVDVLHSVVIEKLLELSGAEHGRVYGGREPQVVAAVAGQLPAVADQLLEMIGDGPVDQRECELVLVLAGQPRIAAPFPGLVFGG
jgi:hypothetical protein